MMVHDYPLPMPDRWEDRAKCAELPVDVAMRLFFPKENNKDRDSDGSTKYDQAKAVCHECAVRAECLDAHIDEPVGCFGGTSPRERRKIRSARRKRRRSGVLA